MKIKPEKMIATLKNVQEIPTLPAVALEINRLLSDEKTTIDTLSEYERSGHHHQTAETDQFCLFRYAVKGKQCE